MESSKSTKALEFPHGDPHTVLRRTTRNSVKSNAFVLGHGLFINSKRINQTAIDISGLYTMENRSHKPYSGMITRVRAEGLLPIEVTPKHLLLVVRSLTSDRNRIVGFSQAHWKKAKELEEKHGHKDGDYLLVPKIRGSAAHRKLSLREFATKQGIRFCKTTNIPLSLPLNRETAWLLGIFVAEGSTTIYGNHGYVNFSFGKEEYELQGRTASIIGNLGYSPDLTKLPTSVRVRVGSTLMARAFRKWCGHKAPNKLIPEFILFNNYSTLLKAFLQGYFSGDGYVTKDGIKASTVSKVLALQVQ